MDEFLSATNMVGRIYDAALDESKWMDFLVPFCVRLKSHVGMIWTNNFSTGRWKSRAWPMIRAGRTKTHAADDAVLYRLAMEATSTGTAGLGGSGGALRSQGSGGLQLQLFIAPLPAWSSPFGKRSAAAISITDPAATLTGLSMAPRAIYRMSPAEARLTEALAAEKTPQEYADGLQLSINTVRTQIRHAAARVGVAGQGDLIRTVLTGPAVLGRR